MNRIYQGRVTKIETLKPDAPGNADADWQELKDWEAALWRHHELFQDAVNYYVVALLALATDSDNPVRGIRDTLAETDEDGKPTDRQVWLSFRRKGITRQGMRDSVAQYFCPDKPREEVTFEDCIKAALEDCEADANIRNEALLQLLQACKGGGGKVRNAAKEFHPLFCDPESKANDKGDRVMLIRKWAKEALPFVLHNPDTHWDSQELKQFTTHSIGTPDNKTPKMPVKSVLERIGAMLELLVQKNLLSEKESQEFRMKLGTKKDTLNVPNYNGGSVKGDVNKLQMAGLVLFQYLDQSERTFEVWRNATPQPPENKEAPELYDEDDSICSGPITLSRGKRGYVFRAFTSLPNWNDSTSPSPNWKEFDISALEEALKALHQIDEKTWDREKEKTKRQFRLDCMENKAKWKSSAENEEEAPPVLAGDPRIARLEELLDGPLREKYEATEGESVAYGLNLRTIRGFRELRDKWNALAAKAEKKGQSVAPEQLRDILRDFQRDNSETIGSVLLFEELIEPENHLIWREPSDENLEAWRQTAKLKGEASFASDPLQALTDKRLLERDMERFSEPIRFTPADSIYSRRLYQLGDRSNFKVSSSKASSRKKYQHIPNQLAFSLPFQLIRGKNIFKTNLRITYASPRLLRDGLRIEADENLKKSPFLQPMMEALGLAVSFPQSKAGCCAVSLMPDITDDGSKRHLLNFPVDIDPAEIQKSLGKQAAWEKQFAVFGKGQAVQFFYPYWPELLGKKAPDGGWWWERGNSFRVLGVDLGQRVAAALAMMDIRANHPFVNGDGKPKPSRLIGTTGNGNNRKEWRAALGGQSLLRLPGEDAKLVTADGIKEEPHGARGRMPNEAEWKDARSFCERLGQVPDVWLGADSRQHSFPELNDKLLVVLRRAQGRLAKLQSLSWRLKQADKAASALEEVKENEELAALLKYKEGADANYLYARVVAAIQGLKPVLVEALIELADRILPLRGRRWEWVDHPCAKDSSLLRSTDPGSDPRKKLVMGQRGLSIVRIEQLEELRRRAQALNRALRHTPGEKVVFGRAARGVELPDPCPEVLEKLDHLKEQRINQTAHGILAAALGVRLKRPEKDPDLRRRHDIHGEYEKFRDPVDFIVLEDLSRYLSSQGRSRRENSRLMQWCHRAILNKVKELAEPYGIPVLETNAAYSSRFCSRTGVAGFRAVELTPSDRHKWFWKTQLATAACEKSLAKLAKPRREALLALNETFEQLDKLNKNRQGLPPVTLLAPMAGGPIFVPAKEGIPVMQADLNAAANLVLRAVAQPDCHEILSRIRTKREGAGFVVRRDSNREKARWAKAAEVRPADDSTLHSMIKSRNPNVFVDLAEVSDYDKVAIEGMDAPLVTGRGLFGSLREKEWAIIRERNTAKANGMQNREDDVPM